MDNNIFNEKELKNININEISSNKKNNKKVLMHTCCAPCSVSCIEILEEMDCDFDLFWYNPNIHPYMEYKRRLDTLIEYSNMLNINLHIKDEYNLEEFIKKQIINLEDRCARVCYNIRLEETAKYASKNGFGIYTTTLLVSPYQNREEIIRLGNEFGEKYGVEFIAPMFSDRFWEGQRKARELGIYMQKYCGCIFSEAERYKKHTWNFKNISLKKER